MVRCPVSPLVGTTDFSHNILYFFPLPHVQGSLRPTFLMDRVLKLRGINWSMGFEQYGMLDENAIYITIP